MKLISKTELVLESFDKCSLICHNECPLGQLYDFSCALKAFVIEKMREAEGAQKPPEDKKE